MLCHVNQSIGLCVRLSPLTSRLIIDCTHAFMSDARPNVELAVRIERARRTRSLWKLLRTWAAAPHQGRSQLGQRTE